MIGQRVMSDQCHAELHDNHWLPRPARYSAASDAQLRLNALQALQTQPSKGSLLGAADDRALTTIARLQAQLQVGGGS